MGFSSEWLERSYLAWRLSTSARLVRAVLCVTSACALLRTVGHVPTPFAIWTSSILLVSTIAVVFHIVRPKRTAAFEVCAALVLALDFVVSLPDAYSALLPAVILIYVTYAFVAFPFYSVLAVATIVSVVHTCAFVIVVEPLHTNEILAVIVVHVWTNFTGIYLCSTCDRIARNAFLSARNSAEAESGADLQSGRLSRLLSAFLPYHLITHARHQITLYKPHLYNEHYSEVSVAYGRLLGFENVLGQCSSIDAARVLKELDARIDRLAAVNGCTRIASEGITVVCSIPGIDSQHAAKLCRFGLELETLINSFRDATGADVSVALAIDSGSITAGVVGTQKWHYDVIGRTVDNALLMQSNVDEPGVYVSSETRKFLGNEFDIEKCAIGWKLHANLPSTENFPVNKRFSMMTVPQAVNRVLQSITAMDQTLKTVGTSKKRKSERSREKFDMSQQKNDTIITFFAQKFRNRGLEDEYHKETDHWFIPSIAISIFFLVVYGIYHMLVMPRLIASLALIVIALTLMFFILLMLYIDYFQSFSQFITRTSAGHAVTILLIITILFLCGIVNTFSCPQPSAFDVCQKAHFSTFSFAMWTITTAVFIRFPSIYLGVLLIISLITYALQIFATRPDRFGPKEFTTELDLCCYLISLSIMVFAHTRRCEKLLRLDFLAVVKGVEETASRDKLATLNNSMLLNVVPAHVAPAVLQKTAAGGDVWHHSHQTVGVAYIAVSGFELDGDDGMTALNYVFAHFDRAIADYKGVEKVKNANRFYIVAVGLVPDAAQNVNETPWTIGELLYSLSNFVLSVTRFAIDNAFHVQIGIDCGACVAYVANTEAPRYELFGETLERSRTLMQAAGHETTLVSEDVYLALRPRPLQFGADKLTVTSRLNAYELVLSDARRDAASVEMPTMPREEQERHTQGMVDAQLASHSRIYDTQTSEMASSMASSFSSELRSIDGDAETDSDLEWVTPETALMNRGESRPKYVLRQSDYDPYREPGREYQSATDASDVEGANSRSRTSSRMSYRRGWRASSKSSLRNGFGLFQKRASSADAVNQIEAAASRVDRMIQELNAYGDFADVKPLEYQPFPNTVYHHGSLSSMNRAMSSACHTEYDNAESEFEQQLSEGGDDGDGVAMAAAATRRRRRRGDAARRWRRDATDGDTESQCSSSMASVELASTTRWASAHSIGYENEYELRSDADADGGLAIDEMIALSRDIRNNFGDFQLATFDDVDQQ
ncbi:unnamed protein product [Caenorhabditis bovis]|uniref:adenylate cyclase n=1 Tax=Caenorhabditis bovis TaxID=2654633 RepID=A0A8S1ENH6_9PELO|nr:unnamed protein product [Caenorhabditis bovis]